MYLQCLPVAVTPDHSWAQSSRKCYQVVLSEQATHKTMLQAYFHACYLHYTDRPLTDDSCKTSEIDRLFASFLAQAERLGWIYHQSYLGVSTTRVTIMTKSD